LSAALLCGIGAAFEFAAGAAIGGLALPYSPAGALALT